MTKDQVQASSKKKVQTVEALCKQMELVVSAEQMITQQGFIKNIVYYTDTEKYDMDEEKVAELEEKINKAKEETNGEDTGPYKEA